MAILYPLTLLTSLKDKHILLDTNIFIDASSRPKIYGEFFNTLRSHDITLATIDLVQLEFLKGSSNRTKYDEKKIYLNDTIDVILPTQSEEYKNAYELLLEFGIDGKAVSNTDLMLASLLKRFGKNIFLLTRDTTDFIERMFNLQYIINCPHPKGIFTYGIYQYSSL